MDVVKIVPEKCEGYLQAALAAMSKDEESEPTEERVRVTV